MQSYSLKEFIVKDPAKTKSGVVALSPALEKIASDLYELCGIEVPKTYLIKKREGGKVRYLLASKIVPGYNDLHNYFDKENQNREKAQAVIEKLDVLERENRPEHLRQYKQVLSELNIVNLEKLLVAYIFLQDFDVIGRYFNNMGLIEEQGQRRIVKIDPGNAKFQPERTSGSFKSQMNASNPLIIDDNLEENDLIGIFNMRTREVFQLVRENEHDILTAIAHLIRIPNEFFYKIIFNAEMLKAGVIEEAECARIFNVLQVRRQAFAEVYKDKLIQSKIISEEDYEDIKDSVCQVYEDFSETCEKDNVSKLHPSIFGLSKLNSNQKKVILDFDALIDKKEKISVGNSRPSIFYKKPSSEGKMEDKKNLEYDGTVLVV